MLLGANSLTDEQMQRIARSLAVPTTAFVTEDSPGEKKYACRFFTPEKEIDMCGHVTVAIATRLARSWCLKDGIHGLTQKCRAGDVMVQAKREGPKVMITLFQALATIDSRQDRGELREACTRILPRDVRLCGEPGIVRGSLGHVLIQLENPSDLARTSPPRELLCDLGKKYQVETICVFSTDQSKGTALVRSRDFCAPIGTYEEPASGTTQAAIGSFLLATCQLSLGTMKRGYVAYQGVEMGSPSRLRVLLINRSRKRLIAIAGTARRVRSVTSIRKDRFRTHGRN